MSALDVPQLGAHRPSEKLCPRKNQFALIVERSWDVPRVTVAEREDDGIGHVLEHTLAGFCQEIFVAKGKDDTDGVETLPLQKIRRLGEVAFGEDVVEILDAFEGIEEFFLQTAVFGRAPDPDLHALGLEVDQSRDEFRIVSQDKEQSGLGFHDFTGA